MKIQCRILLLMLAVVLLLSGCALGTVDKLYCLPKRSEEYENLQAVIDKAMANLTYSAPAYGDNRQFLQNADLDGDGVDEYLLFACDDSDKSLKILIFCQLASGYVLMDTIEGYGFGYDFVSYAQMDDKPGVELIVGRRVSDQIQRSVSVYRFSSGFSRQLMSTACTRVATLDMNGDGISELFLLTPGISDKSFATVHLYTFHNGTLQRSQELPLSAPISGFKLIQTGRLTDGRHVVYLTSATAEQHPVTDIFAMEDRHLVEVHKGIKIDALHNYYLYPEDVDDDGIIEIPKLVSLDRLSGENRQEYVVEWYAMSSRGAQSIKKRTFHNMEDNWFIELGDWDLSRLSVVQTEDNCAFYYDGEKLFNILVLKDADREEQAQMPGRLILHSGESVIYVAELEEYALEHELDTLLMQCFHPIRVDVISERD